MPGASFNTSQEDMLSEEDQGSESITNVNKDKHCNTPMLNSCNLALIVDVIISLNQVWMNSIKSYPNSKTRYEFYFSFEFC
jgi:hypothetical protein